MAKKLLVADDSLTIQKVIKLALSGDGYEIQTVSDGTECLQQVALFRPDVVLIDIGLPGRSAFDLKKAANEDPEMSRIPFVLMSSAFEKVDEAKVALLKFDGRLTKPFDPSNLKSVLNQALQMNAGQSIKSFVPPPAPVNHFSLEPSDNSRQTQRPPSPPPLNLAGGEDITGEIQLMDPGMMHSSSGIRKAPQDPLWSDSAQNDPLGLNTQETNDDIRHLTESTVKMSGLDDLAGWNIQESSSKDARPGIPDMFNQTPQRSPQHSSSSPFEGGSSAALEEMVEKQVREQVNMHTHAHWLLSRPTLTLPQHRGADPSQCQPRVRQRQATGAARERIPENRPIMVAFLPEVFGRLAQVIPTALRAFRSLLLSEHAPVHEKIGQARYQSSHPRKCGGTVAHQHLTGWFFRTLQNRLRYQLGRVNRRGQPGLLIHIIFGMSRKSCVDRRWLNQRY